MKRVAILMALGMVQGCSGTDGESFETGGDSALSDQTLLAPGAQGPEVVRAHEYFHRYGYFENEALRSEFPDWQPVIGKLPEHRSTYGVELEAAVRTLQTRAGLEPTGVIDEATRALMSEGRCGVPDSLDTDQQKWAPWTQRGWRNKTALKYKIANGGTTNLSAETVSNQVGAAFNAWDLVTNLTFTPTSGTADIVITFSNTGGVAATSPDGNISVNSSITWAVGAAPNSIDLKTVMMHEIGHSLGFHHSNVSTPSTPIMWPIVTVGAPPRGIAMDDLQGIAISPYTTYKPLGGQARDVGVGTSWNAGLWVPDGWVISNQPVAGGYNIFRWNYASQRWDHAPGGAVRIDVDGETPWIVNNTGNVYQRSGSSWVFHSGISASDIGVGENGAVWVISNTSTGGGRTIHRYLGGNTWRTVAGGAVRISVDPNGVPWLVNETGAIFQRLGVTTANPDGTSWQQWTGVTGADIAAGSANGVWVTTPAVGGNPGNVYQLNWQAGADGTGDGDFNDPGDSPARSTWIQLGNGANIGVDPGAEVPWVTSDETRGFTISYRTKF
jgi:hypothetical protein